MTTPKASIIVIALNSEATIHLCLESLESQSYPRDKYEIVVVDGGSTDQTQEIVRSYDAKLLVSNSGVRGFDRNVGIRNCVGEIIAFTDSDCQAPEDWLATHVQDHSDKLVGAVGGTVVNPFLRDFSEFARLTYNEKYGYLCGINDEIYVDLIATCNASFKRKVLERAGLFEDTAHIYEDLILCHRITSLGYRIFFDPKIKVANLGGDPNMNAKAFLRMETEAARWYYHAQILYRHLHIIPPKNPHAQIPYRRLHSFLPINPYIVLASTPLMVLGRMVRVLYRLKKGNSLAQTLELFPHVLFGSIIFGISYAREAFEETINGKVAMLKVESFV